MDRSKRDSGTVKTWAGAVDWLVESLGTPDTVPDHAKCIRAIILSDPHKRSEKRLQEIALAKWRSGEWLRGRKLVGRSHVWHYWPNPDKAATRGA